MAERRMFAKTIIDSDSFLDMPLSAQALYFHLSMRADDDGFINNPKKIQRMIGGADDDLKLLIVKKFIIPFESGIVVIKHWKIHNYIQKDRYKETVYLKEKSMIQVKENNSYTLNETGIQAVDSTDTSCIHTVSKPYPSRIQAVDSTDTQVRLGKESIDKVSKEQSSFAESSSDNPAEIPESETPIAFLPLVDGTEYGIKQTDVDGWALAYPAIDVLTEIHKMRAWLEANPKNKKTARGIKRFIVNWLGRSQDSARKQPTAQPQRQESGNPFLDMLAEERERNGYQ